MKKIITIIVLMCALTHGMAQDLSSLKGMWTGKLTAGAMSLTLVLNFDIDANGNAVCSLDSPDQGATGIPADLSFLTPDSVGISIPLIMASFSARIEGDKLNGTFVQMGKPLPLMLERGGKPMNRPQNPVGVLPYKTEEVSFVNTEDHATLAGTLTYPVGYDSGAVKRVPVVLMITGSGPENRDEEIFGHKPFLVIADYLARNGIASLRYDDRATGASVGGEHVGDDATTLDFRRDAAAGLRYLRATKHFTNIGALGHSEGANIAFMLAADRAVDFVVSMAGVGVKCDTALTAQACRIMELLGTPTPDITVSRFRADVAVLNNKWMNWFINYDPTAHIAATTCPVMAINGDKDCQVIAELNLPAIGEALPRNSKTLVKKYEGLNHLFQHCLTGLPKEYSEIEETISPDVLSDIALWINSL